MVSVVASGCNCKDTPTADDRHGGAGAKGSGIQRENGFDSQGSKSNRSEIRFLTTTMSEFARRYVRMIVAIEWVAVIGIVMLLIQILLNTYKIIDLLTHIQILLQCYH